MWEDPGLSDADVENIGDRNERVVLYHATTTQAWQSIKEMGAFELSNELYDWLGEGVYFWQSAPLRAWLWKRCLQMPRKLRSKREDTVVLEYVADVDPAEWLDLLDVRWTAVLARTGALIPELWRTAGTLDDGSVLDEAKIVRLCRENARINAPVRRYLDRAAIEHVSRSLERDHGMPIKAVRSAFQHLDRLYPYAAFRYGDHVQVAIRKSEHIAFANLEAVDGYADLEFQFIPGLTRQGQCKE